MPKFKPETTPRWVKTLEKKSVCYWWGTIHHKFCEIIGVSFFVMFGDCLESRWFWTRRSWDYLNFKPFLCKNWSNNIIHHKYLSSVFPYFAKYFYYIHCPYIFLCCSSHTKSKAFYSAYVTYYYYLGQTMYSRLQDHPHCGVVCGPHRTVRTAPTLKA